MELQLGDLVFVWGSGFVQKEIEVLTHGPSHVAIYIGNGRLIETQGFSTVRIVDLAYYDTWTYKVVRFELPSYEKGLAWLNLQLGRKYDWWDIFTLFVICVFHVKLPWHEGKRIICSRLARDFLFWCSLPIPDENMSPSNLLMWSLLNGGKIAV